MNKTLKTFNIIFIQSTLYLIAKIIPKDKNLIVIGSSLGRYFADNPKYLYLYFHKIKQNKKRMIWISKNREVDTFLKSINYPSEYLYSLKGIFYTIRASKAFISHNVEDINGSLMGGAEIIQLWHGVPLKKIGYNGDWLSDGLDGKLKMAFFKLFPYAYYMTCDKLIAPSEFSKNLFLEPFSQSFRNNNVDKNILVLGQPRNDSLTSEYHFEKTFFPEMDRLKLYKEKYKYIVSWLPTHRVQLNKSILELIEETQLDLNFLNNSCIKDNVLFVIKPHFLELELLGDLVERYSNIELLDAADPYPLLHFSDILITDYSSVYFDFLIKNKPIIFAPFDLEEYKEKVNFYFDYNDVIPGVKCSSWNCIMEQISLIANNIDEYKNDREMFINEIKLVKHDNSKAIYNYFFMD